LYVIQLICLEIADESPLKEDARLMYHNSLLTSRLTSLEREIAMHRRETETLRKSRKDHEEAKLKLDQEQEKFRRFTENEKRRLQLLFSEEQKRLRSEVHKEACPNKGNNITNITQLMQCSTSSIKLI